MRQRTPLRDGAARPRRSRRGHGPVPNALPVPWGRGGFTCSADDTVAHHDDRGSWCRRTSAICWFSGRRRGRPCDGQLGEAQAEYQDDARAVGVAQDRRCRACSSSAGSSSASLGNPSLKPVDRRKIPWGRAVTAVVTSVRAQTASR